MALTQIQAGSFEAGAINTADLGANVTATYATYAAVAANLTPRITTVNVANSSYTVLDDTSLNTSGGFLVITGSNFQSGAIVTIDTTNATSTTFINSTTLRAQTASKTAGSYNLYVTNPDGGTAIKVLGVSFSNTPVWGTAATLNQQTTATTFSLNVSANSDSSITYSNTTTLPAGTTLLSNGYFYGSVTVGSETVYTFTVLATDAENQDTSREFSLTVTIGPKYKAFVTGDNTYGQLGLNNRTGSQLVSGSSQLGSSEDWREIFAETNDNGQTTLATKTNGSLWAWGSNGIGQLGLGDTLSRSSPVQVGSLTDWNKICVGMYYVLAQKSNGNLWAWGSNNRGQLGLGDRTYKSSPTLINSDVWLDIAVSNYTSAAIKTGNTLWTWGSAVSGALGWGGSEAWHDGRSSIAQVGTSTDWAKLSLGVGRHKFLAIKTNNTMWGWGESLSAPNGIGAILGGSPRQVDAGSWSQVCVVGRAGAGGIKNDGTLWTWGSAGSFGQWSLWSGNDTNSPRQYGSDTNWLKVIGTYTYPVAKKANNSLWLLTPTQAYKIVVGGVAANVANVSTSRDGIYHTQQV